MVMAHFEASRANLVERRDSEQEEETACSLRTHGSHPRVATTARDALRKMRAGTGATRGWDDGGCSAQLGAVGGFFMPDLTGLKNAAGVARNYNSIMQRLLHTSRFREAIAETAKTA